jgi:tRNA pseudouridine13 synthase
LQSTRDYRLAYENFPKQLRFERLMLRYLADKPEDFVGAFRRLPTKLQELFVQAHQSYLFNRFLSERLKHGYLLNKAEIGDYVIGVERSGLPLSSMVKTVTNENVASINEQIDLGKMRVALPIVGLRQKLSNGEMGDLEKVVLEKERINLENLRASIFSQLGSKGGLRAAATPIRDFKLHNVTKEVNGGQCEAQLSFMLLRGSYATVLLREIMKPNNPIAAGF